MNYACISATTPSFKVATKHTPARSSLRALSPDSSDSEQIGRGGARFMKKPKPAAKTKISDPDDIEEDIQQPSPSYPSTRVGKKTTFADEMLGGGKGKVLVF